MDPTYQNLVDPSDLIYTLVAYLIHGGVMACQIGFAGFLTASGIYAATRSAPATGWLQRLGMVPLPRTLALARICLAIGLLTPLALGASATVSAICASIALVLLVASERSLREIHSDAPTGAWARRAAISLGVATLAFMAWEREDNLALGSELIVKAAQWRSEELDWQLDTDRAAPKIGDLAPDFELQDPEGQVQMRLSDFRGKRPVVLVFGSYT